MMNFHVILLTLGLCFAAAQAEASKPNILVIMADGVGTGDVPNHWIQEGEEKGKVDMPVLLEQMVEKGILFEDAHATPNGPSSRYAFLSGNYAHRGRSFGGTARPNAFGSQFTDGQQSIAQTFKNQGYQTFMTGKYHIGVKVPRLDETIEIYKKRILTSLNHNWTKGIEGGPGSIGFDSSVITLQGIEAGPYAWMTNDTFPQETIDNAKMYIKGEVTTEEYGRTQGEPNWDSTQYNTRLVHETEKFLEERDESKPFFAYVALGSLHTPYSPPDEYLDGTKVKGVYGSARMDLLGEMDKVVGSLLSALDGRGITNNTIIVFLSDSGGAFDKATQKKGHFSNGPLRGKQGHIYEGGHRIPLIIRWDKLTSEESTLAGARRGRALSITDLYRTLADFATVDIPENQAIDSVSFAGYAKNRLFNKDSANKKQKRTYVGTWQVSQKGLVREAMRWKDYKLIIHYVSDSFQWIDEPRRELFNLKDDILEENDIYKYVMNNSTQDTQDVKDQKLLAQKAIRKMVKRLKKRGMCRDYPETKKFAVNETFPSGVKGADGITTTTCSKFETPWNETITEPNTAAYKCANFIEGFYNCRSTCAIVRENDVFCDAFDKEFIPGEIESTGPSIAEAIQKYGVSPDEVDEQSASYEMRRDASFLPLDEVYSADRDTEIWDYDEKDDSDDETETSAAAPIQTGASQLVAGLTTFFLTIIL